MDKDNKKYIYFNFTDIFDFKRGTRFTEEEHISGDVAYISSTKNNNGIFSYVNPPAKTKKGKKLIVYNNCLTLSNSGSVCYLFYHNYDFVASDHVTVIWIKNRPLTLKIALYLKTIFEKIKYKHNFGREISNNRLRKEKIKLPVDKYNNPDWQYMENYINSLQPKVKFEPIYTRNNNSYKIDIGTWKEFKISDLFFCQKGKTLSKENKEKFRGNIPCINGSSFNNGILTYLNLDVQNIGFKLQKTPSLSLSRVGNSGLTFLQEEDFFIADNAYSLILKNNNISNKYVYLFLKTILNKELYKYSYGRIINNKYFKTKILLPVDKNNNPNWQYMENYIKSLPYGDLI